MENSTDVPQKLKNRTIIWSVNSTSGYVSEGTEITIRTDICIPLFTAALFTMAKTWQKLVSTDK